MSMDLGKQMEAAHSPDPKLDAQLHCMRMGWKFVEFIPEQVGITGYRYTDAAGRPDVGREPPGYTRASDVADQLLPWQRSHPRFAFTRRRDNGVETVSVAWWCELQHCMAVGASLALATCALAAKLAGGTR